MANVFTDENFKGEVLESDRPVLVDFFAEWCGPCKIMGPIIDELTEELKDQIKVGKLNVDENQETAGKYGVMSIPTLVYFENGEVKKTIVGLKTKEEIKTEIGL
jgi:thioredoxin 1